MVVVKNHDQKMGLNGPFLLLVQIHGDAFNC